MSATQRELARDRAEVARRELWASLELWARACCGAALEVGTADWEHMRKQVAQARLNAETALGMLVVEERCEAYLKMGEDLRAAKVLAGVQEGVAR